MPILRSFRTLATTPRRSRLRSAVFQVHLWVGVVIGLYTVVIGLTGSALVFRDEIDRAFQPALQHVAAAGTSTSISVNLDSVVAAVSRENPGFTVRGLQDLERTGSAPSVFLEGESKGTHTAPERMVYFDPQSGRILGKRERYGGFLGWCANLHYYLLAGTRGYRINGVFAACFAVLSVTGWLLWWPGWHSVARALRMHWRARWPRLTWDLHTVGGFWINPALFFVVVTGVFFVFPNPFLRALAEFSGGHAADAQAYLAAPPASFTGEPAIPVQQAYMAVHRALPADMWIGYLSLPADPHASYDAICYHVHAAPYSLPVHVYIDGSHGSLLAVRDTRTLPWGLRAATFVYAVHFGSFAGLFSKAIWFLLGITPAVLLVTGLAMWWRRSLRRTFASKRGFVQQR